jgi:maleate cis-trans isomerase
MIYDPEQLAKQLQAATRASNLAAAYAVLKPLDLETIKQVALKGGYSIIFSRKKSELLEHVQAQVAKAAKLGRDGWALRSAATPLKQEAPTCS